MNAQEARRYQDTHLKKNELAEGILRQIKEHVKHSQRRELSIKVKDHDTDEVLNAARWLEVWGGYRVSLIKDFSGALYSKLTIEW